MICCNYYKTQSSACCKPESLFDPKCLGVTSLLQFYFLQSYKPRNIGSFQSVLAIIFVTVAIAVLTRALLQKQTDQQYPTELLLLQTCCCFPSGQRHCCLEHRQPSVFLPSEVRFLKRHNRGPMWLSSGRGGSLSSRLCLVELWGCWTGRRFSLLASLGLPPCRSEVLLVHSVDTGAPFAVRSLELELCPLGALTSRVTPVNSGVA